ncbi:hypothetical protein CHLNCDRAFT_140783 [Chlorella variabilis]|uniref:Sulfotransferase n=1 Tax=Chlorella variabilis TaxID=554065 RepID=E1Z673_CHLVA|nr:hypothetical protein CHLNCDRAFT_140783 [Chlorella variabilis]EFN58881.1 hypothetical protein CHLNCDRAFT_140783 [Chlorella variabilis]|eukprot:XP_005850983.1 hypothetical protein CHLNCDRAFT_140783 [Chlorella variabilis]
MLARPYWAWSKLALAVLLALSVYCRRLQPHELLNDSQLPGGMQHSRAGGGAAAGGGSDQLSGRRQLGDGAGHAGAVEGAVLTAAAAGANDPHTAAVMAGAGVHGFVRKAGPLDPLHWQAGSFDWRVLQRQSWLDERARLLAEGSPPPPLPLLSSCQVFVNHLYRVIYLRHAKTASSSLLCHFSGCREEKAGGGSGKADTSFQHLKLAPGQELEALWRDYLVVTFVRNPYQRAVSAYKMMARQGDPRRAADNGTADNGTADNGTAAYSWDNFCADPAGFADECLADPVCRKKGREFVYAHIEPQQPCVVSANGGWAVDFIGRVEHMDEDLGAVLRELERRRPQDAPPIKQLDHSLENVNGRGCNETGEGRPHPVAKEQYCNPAEYYSGRHAACFAAVQRHYAGDVAMLQFGPQDEARAATAQRRRLG